jgi:hypothetical protein
MSTPGTVGSDDLFPKKDFYEPKAAPVEKKIPVEQVANALSLQEDEIGLVIIKKRATGGYTVSSTKLTDWKKESLHVRQQLNLAWGRLLKAFLGELKKE